MRPQSLQRSGQIARSRRWSVSRRSLRRLLLLIVVLALVAATPAAHVASVDQDVGSAKETGSSSPVAASDAGARESTSVADASAGTAGLQNESDVVRLSQARRPGSERSAARYATNDTGLVFVVDPERRSYWRLGSYDTFTGDRWERRDEEAEHVVTGSIPPPDRVVENELWLNASIQTLPVAWEPDVSSYQGRGSLTVVAGQTIVFDDPLPADTSHSMWSLFPPEERRTDPVTEYPAELAEIYTQLPPGTTDRFRVFTDELTADAETPYETARTIEAWLRTQKEYTRDARHEDGAGGASDGNETGSEEPTGDGSDEDRPVFDDVVFEMDAVQSEYAATAMVAMLRSEGVPARYTVGYSTGVEHDGRYYVTEQHAHAWVEIYVPGDGWVPFDPTPPDARQRAVRAAHRDRPGPLLRGASRHADATADVEAPPTADDLIEDADAGDPEWIVGEAQSGQPTLDPEAFERTPATSVTAEGYVVEWNRTSPAPSSGLEVTVRDGGEPVGGVAVAFEDRRVGTTGSDGTVVGTVPWVETLTVSADVAASEDDGSTDGGTTPPFDESVDVDTAHAIDVSVRGAAVANASRTLETTLDGQPVPDATVRVAGERAGTTDADGTARVRLPDAPGNVTVAVERGGVVEERTVRVRPLRVEPVTGYATPGANVTLAVAAGDRALADRDVRLNGSAAVRTDRRGRVTVRLPRAVGSVPVTVDGEDGPATTALEVARPTVAVEDGQPLPGGSATVRVEHRGEPVRGATVTVGDSAAKTGADGTATVDLPVANAARIEASVNGSSASTTASDLYRNAATASLPVLTVIGLLGGGALVLRRREVF